MNLEQIKATLLERYPDGDKTALEEYMKIIATPDDHTKEFTEKHHRLPKHDEAWPEYKSFAENKWNMVRLNGGNHFLAHLWLARFSDNDKDWDGAASMCNMSRNEARFISINELSDAASLIKEAREGAAKAKRGKKRSDETRAAMVAAQRRPEVKAAKSAAQSAAQKGVPLSKERRSAQSVRQRGVPLSKEHCFSIRAVSRTSPIWQTPLYETLWNEWSLVRDKNRHHLKRGNFAKHLRATNIVPDCTPNTVKNLVVHFNKVLSGYEPLFHPIEPLQLAA